MTFEIFKWTLAALSILGVILNIRRLRSCFVVWACTNACWTAVDLYHGIWSQAALMAVYFGLAIWGLWEWKKKEGMNGSEESEIGRLKKMNEDYASTLLEMIDERDELIAALVPFAKAINDWRDTLRAKEVIGRHGGINNCSK